MHKDLWDRAWRPQLPQRPRVLLNMVSSLDGRAAIGGKAGAIGGESDRRLMRVLRSRADAVMIGAGTLRSEKISLSIPDDLAYIRASRGLPEQPLHIILIGATNPNLENLVNPVPDRTILIINEKSKFSELGELAPEARDVLRSPADSQGRIDLQGVMDTLQREHGVDLILVEGGPSLNHSLLSNGLADELHLTLASKIIGGNQPSIISGPSLPNQKYSHGLLSIHTSYEVPEGDLFLRYRLTKSAESNELTAGNQASFR